MTALDQWRALLRDVEAATGPDRELDNAIGLAFGWEIDTHPRGHTTVWRSPPYGLIDRLPAWTTSLDAVVALVERETWKDEKLLWNVAYDEDGVAGPRSYCGSVMVGYHSPISWYGHSDSSPALALLAAFLRARIEMEQTEDVG